jgi:hypothetical protein
MIQSCDEDLVGLDVCDRSFCSLSTEVTKPVGGLVCGVHILLARPQAHRELTDNLEVGYLMARRRPRGGVAFPPSDNMSEMREELARMKGCENPLRLRLASSVMHPLRRDPFLGRSGIVCRPGGKLRIDASTLVPRAAGLMGLMLLAALMTTQLACSPGAEREKQHAGRDARRTTAHQGNTPSGKRLEDAPARESETTTTDSLIRWDYVALGDSLAAGVGARRGYVPRYAEHLQSDTGARLRVINL